MITSVLIAENVTNKLFSGFIDFSVEIGENVTIKLFNENGIPIQKTGKILEIYAKEICVNQ